MTEPLEPGDYARKQIHSANRVVAWSHGSRFRLAARLAGAAGGDRLLDYGCGDGTFLELVRASFAQLVGADVDEAQLASCRARLGTLDNLAFLRTSELGSHEHVHAYDVVTCMEVLEHCPERERLRVLDTLRLLVRARGQVIISVPIEIGPALVAKQFFRAVAAWGGQSHYLHRETYTPAELLAAALSRPGLARARYRVETPHGPFDYCGHKGFDWRVLESEIRQRFGVERRVFTPMPAAGRVMNSQVWFICRVP